MKKEKKEGSMHKDSLVDERKRGPTKSKRRNTSLQPPSKTEDHWRPCIIKLCEGKEKSYPITHLLLSSSNTLKLPHHQACTCQWCHVKPCHDLLYAASLTWVMYIVNQMYYKVEVQWTHMNMKNHVSWKVIRSWTIIRIVKEWQGVSITPLLYISPHFIRKVFFNLAPPTRH